MFDISNILKQYNYFNFVAHLVDFCPEAMFEDFLCRSQLFVVLEGIEVREHPHYSWEAMYLTNVEELKSLHFKAKACVNQHQYLQKVDKRDNLAICQMLIEEM